MPEVRKRSDLSAVVCCSPQKPLPLWHVWLVMDSLTPTPEALAQARDIIGPHDASPGAEHPHDYPVEWCTTCRALVEGVDTRIALALTEQAREIGRLRAALGAITRRVPIMGSVGDYRLGQEHALGACADMARAAAQGGAP